MWPRIKAFLLFRRYRPVPVPRPPDRPDYRPRKPVPPIPYAELAWTGFQVPTAVKRMRTDVRDWIRKGGRS